MKIGLLFIKWIFAKIFSKLVELDNDLRYDLRRKPGEAMFFWCLLTLILSLVNLLAMAGVSYVFSVRLDIWFALWLPVVMFAHFIIVSFQLMFKAFKDERAELFNTIKNS